MQGFKRNIEVDVHDIDFNGVCRASSLLRYMQSTAQLQLNGNNMSYGQLQDMKRAFILSKIKLEFNAPVYAEDLLSAITFPCHSTGFSFLRCFQLKRGEETVGRGISVWALVDTSSRALVKVSDFNLGLNTYEPFENLSIERIKMPSQIRVAGTYKVNYSDLDRNRHINNTHYPDIFANFLPLENMRISAITINYLHEAKFGEVLTVHMGERDGIYYFRTTLEDGRLNSEAEIEIANI